MAETVNTYPFTPVSRSFFSSRYNSKPKRISVPKQNQAGSPAKLQHLTKPKVIGNNRSR